MHALSLALLASALPAWSAAVHADAPAAQHVLSPAAGADAPFRCDLPPPVAPDADADGLPSAADLFGSTAALQRQVERHAAIVRVPTVAYDDMGDVDVDPRWAPFHELHRVLAELYPAVHARMRLDKVNGLGLVYSLAGSVPSLRPLMLTAHQDVVPVSDAVWTHPPFAGHYDGRWLWGRGASDDKNSLTALLSALEALLDENHKWTPRRGIVLAFGFDEETGGVRGAARIAEYLEERFGRDAMVLLLDEGGAGMEVVGATTAEEDAVLYASVAVMEKGYINLQLVLHATGGHASVPPPHTGIGIAAELVVAFEGHPYAPQMLPDSPAHHAYVCRARYTPDADPDATRLVRDGDLAALVEHLIAADTAAASTTMDDDHDHDHDPAAVERARFIRYLLQTSQAVDVVHGGVKINALPESVVLGVNIRVAPQDGVAAVKQRIVDLVRPIAARYGLAVEAFGERIEKGKTAGSIVLSTYSEEGVSAVTPAVGAVWDLFAGTIRDAYAFANGTVVPYGDIMNGNTDTRHYHGLTGHVYRWTPEHLGSSLNLHSVDERIDMATHMEALRFFYNLVRNFDAADV